MSNFLRKYSLPKLTTEEMKKQKTLLKKNLHKRTPGLEGFTDEVHLLKIRAPMLHKLFQRIENKTSKFLMEQV